MRQRRDDIRTVRIGPAEDGLRLDRVVARTTGRSTSAGRRLAANGAVLVNGRRPPHPAMLLHTGDRLEIAFAALPPRPAAPTLSEANVLYEDAWLIALDKPAGLPSHATVDPDRPHLLGLARALLERRGADAYLGVHHRLDRDTSGVVLFTKDRTVNAAVGALFAERRIEKTYLACCAGPAPVAPAWSVRDHLGPVGRSGKVTRYGPVRSGGEPASTDLRLIGPRVTTAPSRRASTGRRDERRRWLVEARPHTGRTHQVRAHLAGSGLPIVGDALYGGPPGPRVLLHAMSLRFDHPCSGGEVVIRSPAPPDVTGGS